MWLIDFFLPPKPGAPAADVFAFHWKITTTLLLILLCGGWVIKNVAWAGDMTSLKREVSEIKRSIDTNSLETQLRSIQSELFGLRQKVSELEAKRQTVDPLYYSRISSLSSDEDALRRRLANLR